MSIEKVNDLVVRGKAKLVAAAVQGFRDSNTICCLKHFPGHGDTAVDSHLGLPGA